MRVLSDKDKCLLILKDMKVINQFRICPPSKHRMNIQKDSRLINKELDLVGLCPKMKGRNYLKERIRILIQDENEAGICPLIAQNMKKRMPVWKG